MRAQVAGAAMVARARAVGGQVGREQGLSQQQIISLLTRSPHGDLSEYEPVGRQAAKDDPEFLAHLIAWNHEKGQIRDSKVALPVLQLANRSYTIVDDAIGENALAHLALLDPRNLVRAVRFAKSIGVFGWGMSLRRLVERYLREREARWPWWEKAALQHRSSMKELYALGHVKPSSAADLVLFKRQYLAGSVFEVVSRLKNMPTTEAAAEIVGRKIPFLIAQGALGAKAKEPDLVLALIERMSPAELVTNSSALDRLGVRSNPELRAAYEAALDRASTSKKTGAKLKAGRAAAKSESMSDTTREKLHGLQERQLASGDGIEGDWLVLGDKSGSMSVAIEVAREVSATLAKMVRGKVHLIFFDTGVRAVEVTGKTYDQILAETREVQAGGGTSIGVGLEYALDRGLSVEGIAIVTDAEENTSPTFAQMYSRWVERVGSEPSVYVYHVGYGGGYESYHSSRFYVSLDSAGVVYNRFDLTGSVDHYSIPNLVQTMRVSRFSLTTEIMETPLKTVDEVFGNVR